MPAVRQRQGPPRGWCPLSDASVGSDIRSKRSGFSSQMRILKRPGPEIGRISQESAEICVAERIPAHHSAVVARTDGYPLNDVVAGHARSIYRRPHDALRRQNRAPDRRPLQAIAQEWTTLRSRCRANRFANGKGGCRTCGAARRHAEMRPQGRASGTIHSRGRARHLMDTNVVSAGSWRRIHSTQTS